VQVRGSLRWASSASRTPTSVRPPAFCLKRPVRHCARRPIGHRYGPSDR